MADTTARFNWCEHCVNGTTHETSDGDSIHATQRVRVANREGRDVIIETSYIDGMSAPVTVLGGSDVDMTPTGLDELIAVLLEQRQVMHATSTSLAGSVA